MINPEDKLQQLMNDPHYLEAIRWAFEGVLEEHKPIIGDNTSNQLLGEQYRAYITSKDFIDQCFKKIESYKDSLKINKSFDKAK